MKFPYSMLLDFVQTDLSPEAAGDLLTMAGFELEGIEEVEGEKVLDIKVMSNRGDGLSVFGLAREVLAKDREAVPTELYVAAANRFDSSESIEDLAPNPATVTIETPDCTRYACRVFEGVTNGEAPEWIRTRLAKAGMRSISRLVDLTNYVMLELGQPLHAFDYDKLRGGRIVVRQAREGETLTTLDGNEHTLRPDQMMICDAERPIAAAGIMGGLETEVDEGTTRVLLESAHFVNTSVRRTRKQLGLSTEASYRFERSVDPDGVVAAIERFTQLLGQPGSAVVDVYPNRKERQPIELRIDRSDRLLGMTIKDVDAQHYLERLGMEISGHGNPFYVVPPTWRPDLTREEDLIEELGRVHGYDQIPEALPEGTTTLGGPQGEYLFVDRVREAAIRAGYIQTISHSLRDVHPLDASSERVQPRVPASPDTAYLRNSLLPSLADAAAVNGRQNLHLFEIGKVFSQSGPYVERRSLGLLSTGNVLAVTRKGEAVPQADFSSLKGDLLAIVAGAGAVVELAASDAPDSRFHPTRVAQVKAEGQACGWMGQIHPEIAERLRLPEATFLAEIDLNVLYPLGLAELTLRPISRNPAVGRDISLLIDKAVPFRDVEAAIARAAGNVLERQWLFDVFAGQGIPEGKHSLGIGLQFRKVGENFTDEEANQVRERIVAALGDLGGTTR